MFTTLRLDNPVDASDYKLIRYPTLRIKSIKRALQCSGHTIVGDGGIVKSGKGLYACVHVVEWYISLISTARSDVEGKDRIDCTNTTEGRNIIEVRGTDPITGVTSGKEDEKTRTQNTESTNIIKGRDIDSLGGVSMKKEVTRTEGKDERKVHRIVVPEPYKFGRLMAKEQELWDLAAARDDALLTAWSSRVNRVEGVEGVDDNCLSTNDVTMEETWGSLSDMRLALSKGMPIEYVLGEVS